MIIGNVFSVQSVKAVLVVWYVFMGSFIDITCVVSRLFTGIIINSINYYDWIVYLFFFLFCIVQSDETWLL